MGLTGVSFTSSVGSIAPADVMGLTGQSATVSVAGFGTASGFGIRLDGATATAGSVVTPFYDSLLVKVTSWASNVNDGTGYP